MIRGLTNELSPFRDCYSAYSCGLFLGHAGLDFYVFDNLGFNFVINMFFQLYICIIHKVINTV